MRVWDADDGGPGLAAGGALMKQAILQKYIGTDDFNIVLIFGKTMPAPGLDYLSVFAIGILGVIIAFPWVRVKGFFICGRL